MKYFKTKTSSIVAGSYNDEQAEKFGLKEITEDEYNFVAEDLRKQALQTLENSQEIATKIENQFKEDREKSIKELSEKLKMKPKQLEFLL